MYRKYLKRYIDVTFAVLSVLVLALPLLLVALVIKIESKGPVLFRQQRYGKDKVPFECYKLRTMHVFAPSDSPTRDLKDANSVITKSGRVLRRLGVDEMLQIVNILKGDMSFIGPRPVVLAETDLINERDKYGANSCMPGIGGWAQSNGRDEISVARKARYDGEYIQNFGIKMDISCLWRTCVAIFSSQGFREGHFGDTDYKHRAAVNTKKVRIPIRATFSGAKTIIRTLRERAGHSRGE